MSDIETKTYPPEFLQRLIADHEAEQAGTTTEDSSAVQAKGDVMSETPSGWRPIETAPRDGTSILVWDSSGKRVVFGCWYYPWGEWQNSHTLRQIKRPTHWMPTPGEPTRRGGRDE